MGGEKIPQGEVLFGEFIRVEVLFVGVLLCAGEGKRCTRPPWKVRCTNVHGSAQKCTKVHKDAPIVNTHVLTPLMFQKSEIITFLASLGTCASVKTRKMKNGNIFMILCQRLCEANLIITKISYRLKFWLSPGRFCSVIL